jgi:hypothetical protein
VIRRDVVRCHHQAGNPLRNLRCPTRAVLRLNLRAVQRDRPEHWELAPGFRALRRWASCCRNLECTRPLDAIRTGGPADSILYECRGRPTRGVLWVLMRRTMRVAMPATAAVVSAFLRWGVMGVRVGLRPCRPVQVIR